MSSCLEAVNRNRSLVIAVGVVTVVPAICYLGYRLIQLISTTELCNRISDCFKKTFNCCFPRQPESNTSVAEDEDNDEKTLET